ncbi:DUF2752 domain-containing protein [Cellulomonas flavigena]|uniref:DUF2752 domain-containing protein n=1 Tax=Cellulomonas flavigena TaxID=1711 RepID=UPI00019E49BC|nr:DUF2752 domain-containing protein [Cellulomonas flavigena]
MGTDHLTGERSVPAVVRRAVAPAAVAAAAVTAVTVLAVRSPYTPFSYGFCPSLLVLGVACPGCGGLRATHDLATGDLGGAWGANPLWVLAVPLLAAAWAVWAVRRTTGRPLPVVPRAVPWAVLAVVVAFGVLRNVPALVPYLGPAPLP